jgi:DNA-binding HxlR family transcriptional regulator
MAPRTDFTQARCPVARSMAVLGERWAILILREAFYGETRFDAFQKALGIAPNILSARLRDLLAHGVMEKLPAPEGSGGRHEYRLTEKGRDLFPAYLAIKRWGDRWMAPPEGPVVELRERATGRAVESPPLLGTDGALLGPEDVVALPGPGATPALRKRLLPGSAGPASEQDSETADA